MMIFYNIGIWFYRLAIYLASPFNEKAGLWIRGRKNWQKKLSNAFKADDKVYWFHCASLGEFEQGRPLIEEVKSRVADIKILLTFYSPSGYEVRKDYKDADLIMYLPSDTPANAAKFLKLAKPDKVIFIKYEFWFNYIRQIQERNIPLYLVSGIFRPDQYFFKPYGKNFLKRILKFNHLFVQDSNSEELLKSFGAGNITLSGDTRFDRVYEIARSAADYPLLDKFKMGKKLIIGGSTWPPDEEFICTYINSSLSDERWILAPHEIGESHIQKIISLLNVDVIRYSDADAKNLDNYKVLIIDNIGILSSAYRYGDIAIIGGGFGRGIHNILEPASWGLPVLFGPNHLKFREAVDLIAEGGAFSYGNFTEFKNILDSLMNEENQLNDSSIAASEYIKNKLGASGIILETIL